MTLKEKYQPVLTLGESLKVTEGGWEEVAGKIKMKGTTETAYEKNLIWDKIKEVGGATPTDIEADIKVRNTAYFHKHVVAKGETLGKISKQYYGKAGEYMKIFNANTGILKNPDMIHPGQELVIPNP